IDQVYEIADRMTVLRNGRLVGEWPIAELSQVELGGKMLGREAETLEALEERRPALQASTPILQASGVGRTGGIDPFDLEIQRGEVVGLAGLLGSGRTEGARLVSGADPAGSGAGLIDGEPVSVRSPRAATSRGVGFSPENRRTEGLV